MPRRRTIVIVLAVMFIAEAIGGVLYWRRNEQKKQESLIRTQLTSHAWEETGSGVNYSFGTDGRYAETMPHSIRRDRVPYHRAGFYTIEGDALILDSLSENPKRFRVIVLDKKHLCMIDERGTRADYERVRDDDRVPK